MAEPAIGLTVGQMRGLFIWGYRHPCSCGCTASNTPMTFAYCIRRNFCYNLNKGDMDKTTLIAATGPAVLIVGIIIYLIWCRIKRKSIL